MIRLAVAVAAVLATGCGAGGASRATIESAPPPPEQETAAQPNEQPEDSASPADAPNPAEDAAPEADDPTADDQAADDPTVDDQAADDPAANDQPADEPSAAPAPAAREYPAAVRIGARVADVRTEPATIRLQVGDSLSIDEDVKPTAYDAADAPVRGVRILAAVESRHAVLEDGYLRGISEGEAELRLAIRVPPASGTGPPEIRTFASPVVVAGPPVAEIEIEDPGVRLLAGTVVRLKAHPYAEDGSLRASAQVAWSSNRRRLATVDERGFLRAIRPGAATITAAAEGIEATLEVTVEENPVVSVDVEGRSRARTGDVVRFAAVARDAEGRPVEGAPLEFSVSSFETRTAMGASIYPDGAFVAERPGLYRVTAAAGTGSGQALVEVVERDMEHEVVVAGHGLVADRPTSDLWAFEGVDGRDYVYTGTHAGGQRMLAWDVTNPSNPVLTDFVEVDARVVNDVKVNAAATVAAITREGASDRKNGIVLLDIADPAHPQVASTYTKELTGGVHNVFFHGNVLYAVHNGSKEVHVLDVSNPRDPQEVGRWGIESPGKYLHDIWVLNGMAYVSYWHDGVYVLDVGDGRWGGTPTNPVEVSSFAYPEGNTHFAFPYTNADGRSYLFVGDEIFGCDECISRNGHPGDGSRGFVHILDMEDPTNLREVARYEVPEAGAHNLWIEDDKMYVAYYQAGLRVVDVSGELRGDLYRQGREIAWFPTGTPDGHVPNSPMAWGPQPFKGFVFVSDLNSGLWVLRVEPKSKARVS